MSLWCQEGGSYVPSGRLEKLRLKHVKQCPSIWQHRARSDHMRVPAMWVTVSRLPGVLVRTSTVCRWFCVPSTGQKCQLLCMAPSRPRHSDYTVRHKDVTHTWRHSKSYITVFGAITSRLSSFENFFFKQFTKCFPLRIRILGKFRFLFFFWHGPFLRSTEFVKILFLLYVFVLWPWGI